MPSGLYGSDFYVLGAYRQLAIMRFQIQNAKLSNPFSITPQKDGTKVQPEERQIGGSGDSLFFDIRKIIQTPFHLLMQYIRDLISVTGS